MGLLDFLSSRKNWERLHKSLEKSFNNIKLDMMNIKKETFTINENRERIVRLEKQLIQVQQVLETVVDAPIRKQSVELTQTEIDAIEKEKHDTVTFLTQRQRDILEITYRLGRENNVAWIPVKLIASEMRPSKEYKATKSFFSEYTDILKDLGQIKKKRIRKQSYVKLTPDGRKAAKISTRRPRDM